MLGEEPIQSYYGIPLEYDTTQSVHGFNLSDKERLELEKQIFDLFE
jgi:hypothetical protein